MTFDPLPGPSESRRGRRPDRRTLIRGAVLASAFILVATTAFVADQAIAPRGPAVATPPADVADGAAALPATPPPTSEPEEAWTTFTPSDLPQVATLTASAVGAAGISPGARFALRSVGSIPVATLAKGITLEPAVAFTTVRTKDQRTLTLVPKARLTAGSSYRVTLRTPDGAIAGGWFFRVAKPLRIVSTHPDQHATNVPTDTGIEITFDQDTAGDVSPFFSIEPPVRGAFERHGRTWVFVPAAPLAEATIYTVTVRKGVPLVGSDQVLEDAMTFAFETTRPRPTGPTTLAPLDAELIGDIVEAAPDQAPVLEVFAERPSGQDDQRKPLATMDLTIRRLPGPVSALNALWTLRRSPDWAASSDEGLVPTADLPAVASVRTRIVTIDMDYEQVSYTVLPGPLERGWYLVVRPRAGRDQQLVLQVTDVSAYIQLADGRDVAWVNDVSSGRPLEGAVVWTDRGTRVAATDRDGVASASIPATEALFVTADGALPTDALAAGRGLVVPLAVETPMTTATCTYPWQDEWSGSGRSTHWSVLGTDRTLFRSTDEIDAWGLVRPRDGSEPARNVELRVGGQGDGGCLTPGARAATALVRVPVTPGGRTGTFAASVPLVDLPPDYYRLDLWADGSLLETTWFQVGEIRKPSYTVDVKTDRHVLVDGDMLTTTVTGRFFDGTPAPELRLNVRQDQASSQQLTTGADGVATSTRRVDWNANYHHSRSGSEWRDIDVTPDRPEEASTPEISAGYVLYPACLVLDTEAEVSGGTVRIAGQVRTLDQNASEARWVATAGADWEVAGPPLAGARVHVTVTDRWYVRVVIGRGYDFVHKRAFDRYRFDDKERTMAETDVVVGPDGTFTLDVARAFGSVAAPADHTYDVEVSTSDLEGRAASAVAWAYPSFDSRSWAAHEGASEPVRRLRFVPDASTFAVGDTMRLPLDWGGVPAPTGGSNRYLFLTASRGITGVAVSTSSTFVHAFAAHDVPNASVTAVWFTGASYVVTGYSVSLDRATRTLDVSVTADAPRHAPGDAARLVVRTADPNGHPVAATVVLRGIDERLYAIGAAQTESPDSLYAWVDEGLQGSYASHRVPEPRMYGGQGGDTGGGGGGWGPPRENFRDSAIFRKVTTDSSGTAKVDFALPDDITSWRINAAAFTTDLMVGQGRTSIAVGLPMFIEAPVAPEYLASDRPTLLLRAYGTGLASGCAVSFTVSAPTLGLAERTVTSTAFRSVGVALPALMAGDHRVTIRAKAKDANGGVLTDALVRTIHVVASRFTRSTSRYVVLPEPLPVPTGTGMATYTFSDTGMGRYLWPLEELAWGGGDRVDEALGTTIARGVLASSFGIDPSVFAGYAYSLDRYFRAPIGAQGDAAGVALFPYASPDLALSARVALVAADALPSNGMQAASLTSWFRAVRADPAETSERRNIALAGLAGLDDAVASDVAAALAVPGITVRERLYLALAASVLGDRASALAAERSVVKAYGQELGPWVRLKVGSTRTDILEATSLLALIAVFAGDPIADRAEAYVEEHFSREDLYDLQKAAFLRAAVERAPSAASSFSYTLGGVTTLVKLGRGETKRIELAPSQWRTFSAKVRSGRVGVTVEWAEPVATASVARDPAIALTRTIVPRSPVPADSVVTVVLTPNFGDFRMSGCYRVVDLAPSGLQPLWWAYGGTHGSEDVLPWVISGQKVVFCASPSSARPPRLVYYARVVTPGTYAWEPAIMQAARASESAALTTPTRIEIR